MRLSPIALILGLAAISCNESPTEPRQDPCPGLFNCGGGPSLSPASEIPPPDLALASALRARDRLRQEVWNGTIQLRRAVDWENMNFLGRTRYKSCPFYVAYPDSDPAGVGGEPTCAAGMYDSEDDRITVTTFYGQTQTLALIEWETRNRFLMLGGRDDLAY